MASNILLVIHITAGSIALLMAVVALVTAKGGRYHVLAGRVYATAMTVIFLTALPLALLGASVLLLLIAVFSFYLVFAGWRFARNRRGRPQPVDWSAIAIMGATGLAMWGYGAVLANGGSEQWVTMLIFGGIAVALSLVDARYYFRLAREQRPSYNRRIQRHLTNMLAGTIATVTAVLVVNVDTNPDVAGVDSAHSRHHAANRVVERAHRQADASSVVASRSRDDCPRSRPAPQLKRQGV